MKIYCVRLEYTPPRAPPRAVYVNIGAESAALAAAAAHSRYPDAKVTEVLTIEQVDDETAQTV